MEKIELLRRRLRDFKVAMDVSYFCQTLLKNGYEPCPYKELSKAGWAARKNDQVFVGFIWAHIKISVQGFDDWVFCFDVDESTVYDTKDPSSKYPLLCFLDYLTNVLTREEDPTKIAARLNEVDKGVDVTLTLDGVLSYIIRYACHYSIDSMCAPSKPDHALKLTISSSGCAKVLEVRHHSDDSMTFGCTTPAFGKWSSSAHSSNNAKYSTLARVISYLNWGGQKSFREWLSMPAKFYGIPEVNPSSETSAPAPEVKSTTLPEDNVPKVYDAQTAKAKAAEVRCAKILKSIQINSEKGLFYLQLDSIGAFNNEIHQEIEKRFAALGYSIFRSNGRYVVTW